MKYKQKNNSRKTYGKSGQTPPSLDLRWTFIITEYDAVEYTELSDTNLTI